LIAKRLSHSFYGWLFCFPEVANLKIKIFFENHAFLILFLLVGSSMNGNDFREK
jgi:hypothetical protein